MSVTKQFNKVNVIIPACNEANGLESFLPELIQKHPDFEIIVVNDGSTDNTAEIAQKHGAKVISHPYKMGNGASIKTGVRNATGDIFIFMDADGQHKVEDIAKLLAEFNKGYDMVVGSRSRESQANIARFMGNSTYNYIASKVVGQKVLDLTSGFRVVNGKYFKQFLHLLPNGFSYPSTITMAFFRTGLTVKYYPITTQQRIGKSHLQPLTDGLRFLLIIYKITTLYSPLKIFFPLSFLHFFAGFANYAYTYTTSGRFTNMSAVLLSTAVIIFLIGLVSEQITALMYQKVNQKYEDLN